MKQLKTISSEIKFNNPYWNYRLDRYQMPNGRTGDYHYVDSRGSTMIIPRKDDETFVLINQYRYLNKRFSLEFPGGGLKPGVEPLDNARDELSEETGLAAGQMTLLGQFNPCNGMTNEMCSIYLATGLGPGKKPGDESEEIEIIELNYNDIIQNILSGDLWDGMTLAAWSLYVYSKTNSKGRP